MTESLDSVGVSGHHESIKALQDRIVVARCNAVADLIRLQVWERINVGPLLSLRLSVKPDPQNLHPGALKSFQQSSLIILVKAS